MLLTPGSPLDSTLKHCSTSLTLLLFIYWVFICASWECHHPHDQVGHVQLDAFFRTWKALTSILGLYLRIIIPLVVSICPLGSTVNTQYG